MLEPIPIPLNYVDTNKRVRSSAFYLESGGPTEFAQAIRKDFHDRDEAFTVGGMIRRVLPYEIDLPSATLIKPELQRWVNERCINPWMMTSTGYRFADHRDAFAFKLTWG